MTLLQTLLEQRLILLSLAGTALLLVLAALLFAVMQLRAIRVRRQERRVQQARERQEAETNEDETQRDAPPTSVPSAGNAGPAATPSGKPVVVTAKAPAAGTTTPAPTEEAAGESPVSDTMKDLLSVFVEDSSSGKRALLLKDAPEVDIHELAVLCSQVQKALHGEPTP